MRAIVLQFLSDQLFSDLQAQLGNFCLEVGHSSGALTIDGLLGLVDHALAFCLGCALGVCHQLVGHVTRIAHHAVTLNAGLLKETLVVGLQVLEFGPRLLGLVQGAIDFFLTLFQALKNRAPSHTPHQDQHHQKGDG